jgi:hypothetical protein
MVPIIKNSKWSRLEKYLNKHDRRNVAEATLCTRKYFIEFSKDFRPSEDIRGKNLSMFISRATHNIKFDVLLKAIKSLNLKNILNNRRGLKIIILLTRS